MLMASLACVALAIVARPAGTVQAVPLIEPGGGPSTSVTDLAIEIRIGPAPGGGHLTWVRSTKPLGIPDPLLYLVAAAPPDSNRLPSDAVFVGSVSAEFRGPIKVESPPGRGFLVVWSNGYQRLGAVAPFDFAVASRR